MVAITFEGITKSFGSNEVIRGFDAEVDDKDFLVLLGPSGCGKSTMLRMIAGLTDITGGTMKFDDQVVNDLSPKARNIAFVFQSYALYPHMSVRANIAFPLVMDHFKWWHHIPGLGTLARRALVRRPDISARVEEVARMLELQDYLDRRPRALSGGQRQRVAVARSIIREPSLYLFDEPLSNLDAKLRAQMRAEISALHARVEKTFVYVTHDQVEAMTMGTRIIVMNDGVMQQHGTPREIYESPANTFVAKFIGSPPMNIIPATITDRGLRLAGDQRVDVEAPVLAVLRAQGATEVQVGIRAEKIDVGLADETPGETSLDATIALVEHLGAETIVGFRPGHAGLDELVTSDGSSLYHARLTGEHHFEVGAEVRVTLDSRELHFFDADSGERLLADTVTHV